MKFMSHQSLNRRLSLISLILFNRDSSFLILLRLLHRRHHYRLIYCHLVIILNHHQIFINYLEEHLFDQLLHYHQQMLSSLQLMVFVGLFIFI